MEVFERLSPIVRRIFFPAMPLFKRISKSEKKVIRCQFSFKPFFSDNMISLPAIAMAIFAL